MLDAFLYLKPALDYIKRNTTNEEFKFLYLNFLDWIIIEELFKLFNIFVKLSVIL